MKILNTNYKVKFFEENSELENLGDCYGYCDTENKIIGVCKNHKNTKKFYIHELVHAFLEESFNETKSCDEELVETITGIIVEIMKALKIWDKWKC